jgi:hypothetical protein
MKTYKRELAVALILWLIYVVEVKEIALVEVLVWPIFSFAAAAFGFDQYSKLQQATKSPHRGRSERSSQRTGGQDKYPDIGDDK